jgi:lysozyme family protein
VAKVTLTPALRSEYEALFVGCVIRPDRIAEVDRLIDRIVSNKQRYMAVADAMCIPWQFIAAVHNMEANQSFSGHLHNGDPLTERTKNWPPGKPEKGKPPFTWDESAKDALTEKSLGRETDWSLAGMLYEFERYNGFGYRLYHSGVKSPYLWSFSVHYTKGKYVADGTWSDSAVSAQCGAAVLIRRMVERDVITWFYDFLTLQSLSARWGRFDRLRRMSIDWANRLEEPLFPSEIQRCVLPDATTILGIPKAESFVQSFAHRTTTPTGVPIGSANASISAGVPSGGSQFFPVVDR